MIPPTVSSPGDQAGNNAEHDRRRNLVGESVKEKNHARWIWERTTPRQQPVASSSKISMLRLSRPYACATRMPERFSWKLALTAYCGCRCLYLTLL